MHWHVGGIDRRHPLRMRLVCASAFDVKAWTDKTRKMPYPISGMLEHIRSFWMLIGTCVIYCLLLD